MKTLISLVPDIVLETSTAGLHQKMQNPFHPFELGHTSWRMHLQAPDRCAKPVGCARRRRLRYSNNLRQTLLQVRQSLLLNCLRLGAFPAGGTPIADLAFLYDEAER